MKNKPTNEVSITTEQAINDVLKVEREAQHKISQCVEEAALILERARQKARRISERNTSRITRIHQRTSRKIADDIARIQSLSDQDRQNEIKMKINTIVVDEVLDRIARTLTTKGA